MKSGQYAAVVAGLAVTLAGCTTGGSSDAAATSAPRGAVGSSSAAPASATVADQPFGPGCAQFPASGPGSLADLRTVPMVTGAGRNPQLGTLVHALTAATLVDTLNSTGNITVLAPSDAAFQVLPPASLAKLMADVPRLTAVLTHHVIPGRLGPGRFAGRHTTLDNDSVTITHAEDAFTISGDQTISGLPAHVVCGDIPTVNATVYVVDQVLKPQHLG